MTKIEALALLAGYSRVAKERQKSGWYSVHHQHQMQLVEGIEERFPADGSEAKAMRWLGYAQGVMVASGVFGLDDVKRHSMTRVVPEQCSFCRGWHGEEVTHE